jgi:hypothetical protein
VWICRGIPLGRQILTIAGVALAAGVFFSLALWQGISMLVSTIIGIVFIGGFIGYLRLIAPTPFTIALDVEGITRAERPGRATDAERRVTIPWPQIAKIKEERFKSGKSVSTTVYKRVGEHGLSRAFVVYRDDIGDFDGLLQALRAQVPSTTPWLITTVHE